MTVLTRSDIDLEEGDVVTVTSTSGTEVTGIIANVYSTEASDSYTLQTEDGNEKRITVTETDSVLVTNKYEYITDITHQ